MGPAYGPETPVSSAVRGRRWAHLLVVLAAVLTGVKGEAEAQSGKPPPVRARAFSAYERRVIEQVLADRDATVDESPEGKVIEAIEVAALDVVEPRDPVPQWLNRMHSTSRDYVIAREVLQGIGDRYQQVLIDESSRNLRALPQLSVVACVPLASSQPGKVRLLVISKDVWSIRAGVDASFSAGGLERLEVAPSETNVAGLHQTANLRYLQLPESLQFAAVYRIPRLNGSRVALSLEGGVIVARRTGKQEGSYGTISVGRPLYASYTPWSLVFNGAFRTEITRRYVNAALGTYDAPSTPGDDRLPDAYRSRSWSGSLMVTRAYGWGIKHNLGLGFEGFGRSYETGDYRGPDPRALSDYRREVVPRGDRRLGPILQYQSYSSDFVTVLDYDTLGLQEDVRVGHSAVARLYPALRALGSERNYMGTAFGAGYVAALGDGLARLSVDTYNEFSERRITDAALSMVLGVVTPRLGFGRLVLSVSSLQRYRNFRNDTTLLGGDTNLRGYPSSFFRGRNVLTFNMELRSRPVEILTAQLGVALFYDAGDAFDSWSDFRVRRGIGLGLRALFPQLNRLVLRADLGVPLSLEGLPAGVPPVGFFLSFGQAFKPM